MGFFSLDVRRLIGFYGCSHFIGPDEDQACRIENA